SRRRHTRFSRDWSSDVCSSDLSSTGGGALAAVPSCRELTHFTSGKSRITWRKLRKIPMNREKKISELMKGLAQKKVTILVNRMRSEERRVGKGCGERWRPAECE